MKLLKSMQGIPTPKGEDYTIGQDKADAVFAAINDLAEDLRKECDRKYAPKGDTGGSGKEHDGLYKRV